MLKNMQEVLEYGFEVLNRVYFDNELPTPVITIMSSPRAYGHFTVGKVWRAEETHLNEINISAEHLDRPIENTMATLLHEMVHYYCQLKGIADTSQDGRYHNGKFKEEAEKRGLMISQGKYIGWSVTQPSMGFIEVIRDNEITKPMDINRDGVRFAFTGLPGGVTGVTGVAGLPGVETPKKKTSTRKYVCPCCGNTFRATKDLNVRCMDCNEPFVKVE